MGLSCIQRQPYGFAFSDLDALAKNGDDLGLAGVGDDMRLRTRRLDKGDDTRQPPSLIDSHMLGANPEDDVPPREGASAVVNCRSETVG
jgi:hypothetical protein